MVVATGLRKKPYHTQVQDQDKDLIQDHDQDKDLDLELDHKWRRLRPCFGLKQIKTN